MEMINLLRKNINLEADKLLYQSKKQGKNQTHITD